MSSDKTNIDTPNVFLGGTCNDSLWRDELIELLEIDFFNPVVDDWTPDCMAEEILQRDSCNRVLYVITPEMKGVYSIAEVVDDSNKQPKHTILCIMASYGGKTFSDGQMKSLMAVGSMVKHNGGKFIFDDLRSVADYLNTNKE